MTNYDFFPFHFKGLQLLVLQPKVVKSEDEAPSLKALIMDPYILIAAGMDFFDNLWQLLLNNYGRNIFLVIFQV